MVSRGSGYMAQKLAEIRIAFLTCFAIIAGGCDDVKTASSMKSGSPSEERSHEFPPPPLQGLALVHAGIAYAPHPMYNRPDTPRARQLSRAGALSPPMLSRPCL